MKKLILHFILLMTGLSSLAQTTVLDVVIDSENHNTLEAAVLAAGLETALGDPMADLTVFAPTDAAFSMIPSEVIDALLADPTGDLTQILLYHVLGSSVESGDLQDGMMVETLQGNNIYVSIDMDGTVMINDATVIDADIVTDNGVVHVIDAVIQPYTTVLDVVVDSENHNTLEAAVLAAGLETALGDPMADLTVFAPTDAAFSMIPSEVIDALLADPTGDLTQILLYHVLGSSVESGDLQDGMMVETLQGNNIYVSIDMDGTVMINDATVIDADIVTDNGVVHVIDAVLGPDYNVGIHMNNETTNDILMYSVDVQGKIIDNMSILPRQIVFDVYSSGKVKKRVVITE